VRTYDKEFKLSAVNLYLNGDRTYTQISEELGIPSTTLMGWVKTHRKSGASSFPGKGNVKECNAEMVQLRKELAVACEERDILKKALGIFSSTKK
jgi:transposase